MRRARSVSVAISSTTSTTGAQPAWVSTRAHGVVGIVVFWVGFGLLAALSSLPVGASGPISVLTLPVLVIAAVIWWTVPWAVRGFALLARALLAPSDAALARRVEQLTVSRAATVDAQAAELRVSSVTCTTAHRRGSPPSG